MQPSENLKRLRARSQLLRMGLETLHLSCAIKQAISIWRTG